MAAPRPWTVEEFLEWERQQAEQYEHIDGVIRMMVGGTSDHFTIAGNLFAILRSRLRGGPCRAYFEGMKVDVGTGVAYPDAVVTCSEVGPRKDEVPEPVVIAEVLSKNTESLDRGAKWISYQTLESLRQHVLLLQDELHVEVYDRTDGGWQYNVLPGADVVLRIAVGGIEVGRRDLYEDTSPLGRSSA